MRNIRHVNSEENLRLWMSDIESHFNHAAFNNITCARVMGELYKQSKKVNNLNIWLHTYLDSNNQWLESFENKTESLFNELEPKHFPTILYSAAQLSVTFDPYWVSEFISKSTDKIDAMTAMECSNFLMSFTLYKYKDLPWTQPDEVWLKKMEQRTYDLLPQFTSETIRGVLGGFKNLNHQLGDAWADRLYETLESKPTIATEALIRSISFYIIESGPVFPETNKICSYLKRAYEKIEATMHKRSTPHLLDFLPKY